MATHFFVAGQLAMETKGNADAAYKGLVANLIPTATWLRPVLSR
jgi:hypothetical protein